jgi:hypothetical protein
MTILRHTINKLPKLKFKEVPESNKRKEANHIMEFSKTSSGFLSRNLKARRE